MTTDKAPGTCNSCGSSSPYLDKYSFDEILVTDYQKKTAHFTGFPSGETHTVEGWKLQYIRTIDTHVCPNCIQKAYSKSIPTLATIITTAAVLLAGLLILVYLIIEGQTREHNGFEVAFLLGSPLILLFTGIVLWAQVQDRWYNTKRKFWKDARPGYHRGLLCQLLGKSWEEISRPLDIMFVAEPYNDACPTLPAAPRAAGALFYEQNSYGGANLAYIIKGAQKCNAGWSAFTYKRDYAYNSSWLSVDEGEGFVGPLGLFLNKDRVDATTTPATTDEHDTPIQCIPPLSPPHINESPEDDPKELSVYYASLSSQEFQGIRPADLTEKQKTVYAREYARRILAANRTAKRGG